MKTLLFLALLQSSPTTEPVAAPAPASAEAPSALPTDLPKAVAKLLAKADGRTQDKAIKVRSIDQEYEVLRALGFVPDTQSLIVDKGKSYDMIEASHRQTGEKREFWFDISSFFGRGFGF